MRKVLSVSLLIAVFAALSISTAFAAETSVSTWWTSTSRGATNDYWCDWTNSWSNGHYQGGIFHNGDGFAQIRMEQAGWDNTNTFGWFGWDEGGNPINVSAGNRVNPSGDSIGLYQIFGGTAPTTWASLPGTTWEDETPGAWGFYLKSGEGKWYFSAPGNVSSLLSGTSYDFEKYRMQVFDDPAGGDDDAELESAENGLQWVLCWEDRDSTASNHTAFDMGYAASSSSNPEASRPWTGSGTIGNISAPTEPDYNDMVITFQRYNAEAPPGDDSPEPATWALLLATCAFGGLIRRRRRE